MVNNALPLATEAYSLSVDMATTKINNVNFQNIVLKLDSLSWLQINTEMFVKIIK
jgi:hypothetical protein